MSDSQSPSSNSAYDWSKFDSEAYFQHYYGEPHPDDDQVVRLIVDAFKKLPEDLERSIDVGTGPNLFPLFSVMPRVRSLTAWEYAASNVAWLKQELESSSLRSQWRHWWDVARDEYGAGYDLPDNPIPALKLKTEVRQGSIFDLPERQWDAATMFFCAESITRDRAEFERATACFARSVKSGGFLVGAFLVHSGGYVVADRPFPVLSLTSDEIIAAFSQHATDVRVEQIGIVEREIRSGYSGFVFLTGAAK
ncbi:MAG TPA: hypothetical protein VG841_03670 [Caulobacterales bacterium]|nr:hypothetical protein [Caulobacterales bacterium]